jgi:hypothetical protein
MDSILFNYAGDILVSIDPLTIIAWCLEEVIIISKPTNPSTEKYKANPR